jgi:hypothetical protein
MASVACAAVIGLLCATSSDGNLSKTSPSFFEVATFATNDYRVEYNRSDLHSSYDLQDFRAACSEKDCLWIKAHAERCAVAVQFGDATKPRGMTNLYYALRSKTVDGLKRGLAETYVRRRAGDDSSFTPLTALVRIDVEKIVCP